MNDKQRLLFLEKRLSELELKVKNVETFQQKLTGQLMRIAEYVNKAIKAIESITN